MRKRHSQLAFAGSVHFVTTVTRVRGNWFNQPDLCESLLRIFEGYRDRLGLECFGYVLMPDHLHTLLRQNEDGCLVPALMEGFKSLTSRNCRPINYPDGSLWTSRYDDVPVPGAEAVRTKLTYIHNNPIRRGIAERPEDYIWSSAREYWDSGRGIVTITDPGRL